MNEREPNATPPRSLVGRRLGVYEVRGELGAGAMGQVYRAHDARLGRDVAMKFLPPEFARDPERVARFEREARVLASLNHSQIAALYSVEESEGLIGLVLELVDGETLAELLSRGPLPVAEAVDIARQIAAGMEAAHEKGIVHRDLKPANIKVGDGGAVKILDFGLAKAVEGSAGEVSEAASTVTDLRTAAGVVLGTVAYMSPEQARGRLVDRRTDIWAFGCILYEMLAGRRPFVGDTTTDTLAAIVEHDPDWTGLPASTPTALRLLLQRCLAKDPFQRLRDIGDARLDLEGGLVNRDDGEPRATRRALLPWAVAATATLALVGALYLAFASRGVPAAEPRVSRFTVQLPPDADMFHGFNSDVALSRDGSKLAVASFGGVFVRPLDGLETVRLEATEEYSSAPFFSPDGARIAFIGGNAIISAQRPLLVAALSGGAAVQIAEYDMFHRGDWGDDGNIYWTARYPGGIVRTPASGGESEVVTELDVDGGELSHRFVSLLPGGQALLYTVGFTGIQTYDDARIDVFDLRTRQAKTVVSGGMAGQYAPSGHIVYARGGKLWAVPFDAARLEVTGAPYEVLSDVMMSGNTGAAQFAISRSGDLVYVPGSADGGNRTLVWVDRSGRAEPLSLPSASYLYPRISPDGTQVAVEVEGPTHDVLLYDHRRGVLSKMTTDGLSHDPVWSPDGSRFAFRSWRDGGMTMWTMPADRSAPALRLDPTGTRQSPVAYSPDGAYLSFDQKDPQTGDDVWALPIDGGPAIEIARSRFEEGSGKFSPDGRWIAFASDESGRPEIYVQAFPGPGPRVQVSSGGGIDPVWRRQGGELYYRSADRMMAVSIQTSPALKADAPVELWEDTYSQGSGSSCGMPGTGSANYDVSPDGQRFLMVRDDLSWDPRLEVVVVLNWFEEIRRRDPRLQ